MTTLSKSVKFRALIDQLCKQELMQFINKLYDDNKIDLIKTSIFRHFNESVNDNDDELNNINSVLSNIIQSRKIKSKPLPTTNIKFDQLSLHIIGHTASFLDQWNYFRLQQVNRTLLMGCNDPNMLKKLNLCEVDNYLSINLSQYRSLKQLQINLHKFDELRLPKNEEFILNELDDLSLNAKMSNHCDIEAFMNQKCINIENIKKLRLEEFGDYEPSEKQFNFDTFWRLLTNFRNIEYLELFNIFPDDIDIDTDKLKESNPNLKGLSVNGGYIEINNTLINIFGNNLYFLKHTFGDTDLDEIDFNKLEELIWAKPNVDGINNILKTASNLKKIYIEPIKENEDELKSVIFQIFKCKSLEHFEIDTQTDKHFEAILGGIGFALYETNKWKRKQLTIDIGLIMECGVDIKRGIYNIGSIISRLDSSKINDFMFIWDLQHLTKQDLNENDILNDLKDISTNIEVKSDGLYFVITNKKCKINGWITSWMFED